MWEEERKICDPLEGKGLDLLVWVEGLVGKEEEEGSGESCVPFIGLVERSGDPGLCLIQTRLVLLKVRQERQRGGRCVVK